ncbi:MAG TPA: BACON domain-containing carbohydrate-binding protein, partial [Bryobacteraceae bacterium]|nr:BACON domain-containing carbohydrate-binding protein [Bryobacteraceae bacterium]
IPIGQRAGLDISDIAAVRKMYSKQTATVSVSTVPTGLTVTVDGLPVVTPASFNWPAGSVHTIGAPASIVQIAPSQYSFVRWTDGGAATHTITVPSTGLAVAATYALQHKLTTAVATTYTGSTAIAPAASTTLYGDGLKVAITATPASGYCFSGWTGLTAGTPNQTTVSMTRSYAPVAAFIPGAVTPAVTAASIPAAGGTFTMNTTATTGCGWGIKSSASWLTVSKTYATSASPSFSYTVQPNTTGVARTAYLTIHNRTVTITQ